MQRTDEIRQWLLVEIDNQEPSLVSKGRERFGVSRQAIHKHLAALLAQGLISEYSGSQRGKIYEIKKLVTIIHSYKISPKLREDEIWRNKFLPNMKDLPRNVIDICQYGFTEILNNAIDHSEGSTVKIVLEQSAVSVQMHIQDNGVGIFRKIKREFDLADERHAILDLAKGKLTTDPARHTGEGIFFTSRAFDTFEIHSWNLFFLHKGKDFLFDVKEDFPGTIVSMKIHTQAKHTLQKIFDEFAGADDFSFSETIVPVILAQYGEENLVSRSQAKRLLTRLDRFKKIIFDFEGVNMIGQAFADEIFRVFQAQHPQVQLNYSAANEAVERMIRRAKAQEVSQ